MAKPLSITITESIKELRSLQPQYGELIGKRILMLITIKKHEKTGISKRALSELTGINHNSIVKWRKMYLSTGITDLLIHGRKGGFKPSVINPEEHDKIKAKLHDAKNAVRGYVELLDWIKTELGKDMKYTTLVEYTKRHFGAKIKTARKSHVKKDEEAVSRFKKTSRKNARN